MMCDEILTATQHEKEPEETETIRADYEEVLQVEAGKAIEDSGCTSPVMGEITWNAWLDKLIRKGLRSKIFYDKVNRCFRFWQR